MVCSGSPVLCLAENENPIDGFPSIVQKALKNPDGSTILRFKAILTSDVMKRHARDAVLQQSKARALWTKDGLKEDQILVEPWPVVHAVIALVDLYHDDKSPPTSINRCRTEFAHAAG